ncbi:uncharacterized protein LOC135463117 [Liolophura sinensis]|uniref:uncharacterized protein LOC135463117 n=1 Tax=Liolophura sinensis TaxID=3198878 RepID=UPI0031583955
MPDYVEFDDPYDTDGLYEVEELRVRLGNLLLMTAVIITGLFMLFILWKLCFADEGETPGKQPRGTPQAVYAHEIEPGFVVLQSQDGQFFRILQEYSEAKWNRPSGRHGPVTGSENNAPLTRTDSSSTWRGVSEAEATVYAPHYTSAHYQTQPSAPLPPPSPPHLGAPLTPLPQLSTMSDNEVIYFDRRDLSPLPPPYHARD